MKFIPFFALIVILSVISGCVTQSTFPSSGPSNESPTMDLSKGTMTVSFIDVGQGDSELIQLPSGKTILIDAGPNEAASNLVNYLHNQGISTINIVVATHPHEDHIGGMEAILNQFKVEQFIDSGYPATTSTYENMLNLIDQKNIPFQTVGAGNSILFDSTFSVQVLNPTTLASTDMNQDSIVFKMQYGKISWLFTGDAEEPIEDQYATAAGHTDILKVAHHASSSSSGSNFISQVTPSLSIIEVGAGNTYGHPDETTLQRLQQYGSKIYRTDLDGTITVTSDGSTYMVSTGKQRSPPVIIATTPVPANTLQDTTISATVITRGSATICDCSKNLYNCADFKTQSAAQACFDYCDTQGRGDVHGLDSDKDKKACESLA